MESSLFARIQKILTRNKKLYLEYNHFRKTMFSELSPKESEAILYLLPWLLSVNDPACPGYIERIRQPFRVYNIETVKGIKEREPKFKKMFGVKQRGTLLKPGSSRFLIQGLYTIGSVGTVSQTTESDCDIWVCFNKKEFDKKAWEQINQKLNLIKDWMDINLKMPVFFFISDVDEIRENRFGSVDSESSGSAQQNTLKEEFYRTCILICGKIPLWWLCIDGQDVIDYTDATTVMDDDDFMEYDLIDLGNLEKINRSEYFGAALWQFQKSLSFPLKSIVKMALLKMALDAPNEQLLCHMFREKIFRKKPTEPFPDASLFMAGMIFEDYGQVKQGGLLTFLKECFYLKCQIKTARKNQVLKNKMANAFFKIHTIPRERKLALAKYEMWNFKRQVEFGESLFKYLIQIYTDISSFHSDVVSESDRKDLTILGRKISACYSKKENKIAIVQKPTGRLNIAKFSLGLENGVWKLFAGNDQTNPLVSSRNIVHNIAFMVWNDFFSKNSVHMRPNASNITIQEIKNLGQRIGELVGTNKTVDVGIDNYLKEVHITKILVVCGFERSPWANVKDDYSVVYINCWGELFVERFNDLKTIQDFLESANRKNRHLVVSRYLRRNSTSYEKTIARTKASVFPSL